MKVKRKPQLHASWIDPHARQIVEQLQRRGYVSYLVGGCVRDLLVGVHPKDYDIATNASPQEVRKCVPQSFVIGKRFRLVLVKRRDQQFEVATFRRSGKAEDIAELPEGSHPSADNFFGTPEEDALRRDFTVNALFYDPVADQLIDYASGLADIASRTLRMIGDPATRIIEDSIRILRAIRLAHKLNFQIASELRSAMQSHASELQKAVLPRRREEFIKILRLAEPERAFLEMWDLGILQQIAPALNPIFEAPERLELFLHYLRSKDQICLNPQLPTEVFAPLIWAFYKSMMGSETAVDSGAEKETLEALDIFMRRDLGLFKTEQADILAAMELIPRVKDVESMLRRGSRRQQSFMSLPHLPLSLRFACNDYLLSGQEVQFWKKSWAQLSAPAART